MMEEVLVWVMNDAGRLIVIGTVDSTVRIWHEATPGKEPWRGTSRMESLDEAEERLLGLTESCEINGYPMVLEPTVLRLPPPPIDGDRLDDWVEAEVMPAVQTRMKMQRVAEIRRKQATGRSS